MSESRNSAQELGDFLRTRRAALSPEGSGVPTYGAARRVPGLRREEVARLAGLSVNYYARLEQGESHRLSDSVLEAIANVLRLGPEERQHLLQLARPTQVVRHRSSPERARDSLLAIAESAIDQAVIILGSRTDLLGANRLGYALFGLRPDQRPNMAKMTFLDPAVRDLLADWPADARSVASYLRMASGEQPNDPLLAELIGELCIKSGEFARIWAEHPVSRCGHRVHEYHHPQVGHLVLNEEALCLPEAPGQRVVFSGAEPGSESADRLRLLDSLVS